MRGSCTNPGQNFRERMNDLRDNPLKTSFSKDVILDPKSFTKEELRKLIKQGRAGDSINPDDYEIVKLNDSRSVLIEK